MAWRGAAWRSAAADGPDSLALRPRCFRALALWAAGGSLRGRAPGVAQALCPLAASTATLRVPAALLAWSLGGARGPKTSNRKIPVILIKDAPNLGFRGEEVAVRPGYARNFLIPQQLVVYSTHENKSLLLQEKSAAEVICQRPSPQSPAFSTVRHGTTAHRGRLAVMRHPLCSTCSVQQRLDAFVPLYGRVAVGGALHADVLKLWCVGGQTARVEESRRVQELQRRLSRLDLTIKRNVNDEEQMYGSVTAKNISEKLAKSNLKVAEKDVLLEAPIKV